MDEKQAAALLSALATAYPNVEVAATTAQTWAGALRSVRVEDARVAYERLIRTCKFFPSIAEFFNEEHAARRARENREAADRGLPAAMGVAPRPGRLTTLLSQLREELYDSSAKDHWHGGPDPCPKCGGTKPALVTSARQR